MFDFHIHTRISFDGESAPEDVIKVAEQKGLKEICFTDHLDYDPLIPELELAFDTQAYNEAYNNLQHPDIKIRRGMEFGMLPDNQDVFRADLLRRPFDFVIGSVHFVDGLDIYYDQFWQGKTVEQAESRVLEQTLACVQAHDCFDVLGHLTYVAKADANPVKRAVPYDKHKEVIDEILRTLVQKGKGLEINTSGIETCGCSLPSLDCLRRFKELGGEIVTVGSDAHVPERVGQYCDQMCEAVAQIFGYVCTFADRKPIFHKI